MHRSTNPTTAAAGHPDHVPAPLRQTDLPLRGRRAAREPRTAVHRGRPDQDLTLTAAEVAQVTAALARYERAKADLDAQAAEGIARLRGSRAARGSTR